MAKNRGPHYPAYDPQHRNEVVIVAMKGRDEHKRTVFVRVCWDNYVPGLGGPGITGQCFQANPDEYADRARKAGRAVRIVEVASFLGNYGVACCPEDCPQLAKLRAGGLPREEIKRTLEWGQENRWALDGRSLSVRLDELRAARVRGSVTVAGDTEGALEQVDRLLIIDAAFKLVIEGLIDVDSAVEVMDVAINGGEMPSDWEVRIAPLPVDRWRPALTRGLVAAHGEYVSPIQRGALWERSRRRYSGGQTERCLFNAWLVGNEPYEEGNPSGVYIQRGSYFTTLEDILEEGDQIRLVLETTLDDVPGGEG